MRIAALAGIDPRSHARRWSLRDLGEEYESLDDLVPRRCGHAGSLLIRKYRREQHGQRGRRDDGGEWYRRRRRRRLRVGACSTGQRGRSGAERRRPDLFCYRSEQPGRSGSRNPGSPGWMASAVPCGEHLGCRQLRRTRYGRIQPCSWAAARERRSRLPGGAWDRAKPDRNDQLWQGAPGGCRRIAGRVGEKPQRDHLCQVKRKRAERRAGALVGLSTEDRPGEARPSEACISHVIGWRELAALVTGPRPGLMPGGNSMVSDIRAYLATKHPVGPRRIDKNNGQQNQGTDQ